MVLHQEPDFSAFKLRQHDTAIVNAYEFLRETLRSRSYAIRFV